MKIALINPAWRYDGSISFGCREPHLPLDLSRFGTFSDLQDARPVRLPVLASGSEGEAEA